MIEADIVNMSRRSFLKTSSVAAAGLTLGVYFPSRAAEVAAATGKTLFEPNAFVRIGSDNTVTIIAKHLEMGQGTYTGLATLVAEELDAAWAQVRVEGAPANAKLYKNLFWGDAQGTGGSTAIANSFEQMRKAGASARAMLVAAAVQKWKVPAKEISVRDGVVSHARSKRRANFGELAMLAASQPVPDEVKLKDPKAFRLIGMPLARKDGVDKTNGTALFTQDVTLPGLLTALVVHAPRFGAKVKEVSDQAARQVPGVVEIVNLGDAVAVLAKDFWSAKKGRDALGVNWDESAAFKLGSEEIMADYRRLADTPGLVARRDGDAEAEITRNGRIIEATYEFPYLAHAAMEPMNCVARITANGCELWYGAQSNTRDQHAVANLLGISPEDVTINMLYAGGSFGRRSNPHSDFVLEAVRIAKAINGRAPVKLVWTREDDMCAGYYRPMYFHRLRAALGMDGAPLAWHQRIVGQSIISGTPFAAVLAKNGIDRTSVEGAANLPYAVPNVTVELHSPVQGVPVLWWRSVGSTHTAFAVETFLDELATTAGKDPVAYRRMLLKDHPRHRAVLDLAAARAGWGKKLGKGRGRGIAVHESFNSFVAQVAEITVLEGGRFSVDRVVIAVDCGIAINPDIIVAQMEGGMGFGLSAALGSRITLKQGRVEQSNFHDYPVLRMEQMPKVEVHIVKSAQPPTGVGEPATPVIAPAVANALHAATGQRFRALPLTLHV